MWINPALMQIWILAVPLRSGRRRVADVSTSAGGVNPKVLPSGVAWCRAARVVMRACVCTERIAI